MAYMDELRFLWNLVWDPEKYAKRHLDFSETVKLYYILAILPFIAYVVLGSLSVALGYSTHHYAAGSILTPLSSVFASFSYLSIIWGGILLFFVALPLGIAIDAFIYQLIAKIFLGVWKGSYDATFTALIYGVFPLLLMLWLSVIPIFNSLFIIIAPIWSIIVIVIALSVQQKITRLNALIIMAVKSLILILVFALISVSVFSAFAYVLGNIIPVSSIGPLSNMTGGWVGSHVLVQRITNMT